MIVMPSSAPAIRHAAAVSAPVTRTSDRTILRGGAVAVLALNLIGWVMLYRHVLFTGDDFNHVARGGHPGGRMSAGDIWQSYVTDYTEVNGRAADAIARIILQNDVHTWQLLGPLVLTAIPACIWMWATTGRAWEFRQRSALPVLLLSASIPFVLLAVRPVVGGQAIFWVTAAIGYFGAVLLTLASGLYFAAALDHPVHPGWGAAVALPIMLTHLFHETSSFALMAMIVAFWVLGGRRVRTVQNLVLTALSAAAFLANALSPGALSRFSRYDSSPTTGGYVEYLAGFERGSFVLLNLAWPGLLLVAATTAVGMATRRTASGVALLAGVSLLLGWNAVRSIRADNDAEIYAPSGIDRLLPYLFVGVLALLFWHCLSAIPTHGRAPVLLLAATVGAAAIPVALGAWDRGHVPAAVFAYAFAIAVAVPTFTQAWEHGRRPGTVLIAGLIGGAVLVTAVTTGLTTYRGLEANAREWNASMRQIEEAKEGAQHTVNLPRAARMPAPSLVYHNAWSTSRFEYIRDYYEIPPNVKIQHTPTRSR